MKLSLAQTATVLGKSERQVRYLIKLGRLQASKATGTWEIDEADLPLTAEQRTGIGERVEVARQAFEKAVEPAVRATESTATYSVTKLAAFTGGEAVYRELRDQFPADPAVPLLFAALEHLTRGCHAFHADEKRRHFREARGLAAAALTHLLLGGQASDGTRRALAERLEQAVLPKISGLIAACEKRARQRRPEHFGALESLLNEGTGR
jgi:hypothetical protein